MSKFEQFALKKNEEDLLYEDRENFIKENYPQDKGGYEMQELLNSGLDGMETLEKRGKDGELEGLLTYTINQDHKKIPYLSIGIMLTSEEFQGEGVMKNLFSQLKKIARKNECKYITAIADTEMGMEFLFSRGFNEETDEINGKDYLRLDL